MSTTRDIKYLKKQFLCCVPLNRLDWRDVFAKTDEKCQIELIDATVNDELVRKYPVKQTYKKLFLKTFITKLEENGIEIADEVYNAYCEAIAVPDDPSSMHFRHFILDDDGLQILSMKESRNIISHGTTGLCSWKAAFCLAEWCAENKQILHGQSVIELGSGVGLTGLAILQLCAPTVYYFSDCHSVVLKTLEDNVRLNLCANERAISWKEVLSDGRVQFSRTDVREQGKVEILDLKWEDIGNLDVKQLDVDLIIAADVLYDNSAFESLVTALKLLMYKSTSYAILAATVRNENTVSEFLDVLDKYDLEYSEETTSTSQIFVQSDDTPVRILKIFRQFK